MSFDWTTLGEYARVQGGFAYKSSDFQDVGFCPVLKIKNIRFGNVSYEDTLFIDEKIAKETSNYATEEGDILISMTGSGPNAPQSLVGRVARVWKNEPKAWINQRVGRIVLKGSKEIHPDFLFYLLSVPQSQSYLVSNSSGSANQANISGKTIESLPCPKLTYDDSVAIARILKSLDEKIIINTQINHTLEQIAQAIFKSWFVDFDPVKVKMAVLDSSGTKEEAERAAMCVISGKDDEVLKRFKKENPKAYTDLEQTTALFPSAMQDSEFGEIPEGWEIGKLSDLIEFNPTRTLKKGTVAPYLDMKNMPTSGHLADNVILREMNSGTKFINGDTLLARITPCLENGKTAYVDFLKDNEVGWGSTEYIVMRPHENIPKSLGYFIARNSTFRMFAIKTMTGSSGRQRADSSILANLPWLKYPMDILNEFGKIADKTLIKAKSHGDENKVLTQLRDTLLPKLISGEIELECLTENDK